MEEIVALSKRGLYLKNELLKQLGVKPGDRVVIRVKPGMVIIRPVTSNAATLRLIERLNLPAGTLKSKAENPQERIDLQDEIGADFYDECID